MCPAPVASSHYLLSLHNITADGINISRKQYIYKIKFMIEYLNSVSFCCCINLLHVLTRVVIFWCNDGSDMTKVWAVFYIVISVTGQKGADWGHLAPAGSSPGHLLLIWPLSTFYTFSWSEQHYTFTHFARLVCTLPRESFHSFQFSISSIKNNREVRIQLRWMEDDIFGDIHPFWKG